jgi:hypothetical protein
MQTASLVRILVIALAGSVALLALQPPAGPADLVLFNGKVVTVDARFSIAQAVAIAGERFVAVGSNDEVRSRAGSATRQIDLGGKTVIPGLADGHLHNAGGGAGVDLSRARTLADVLQAIGRRVAASQPVDIIVTNSDWHEAQLAEQRLPLRRDLDTVALKNPVVVVRGGHEYILNSAALAKWGIDRQTPEPPGGRISRYPDGEPNGELVDAAKALVRLPPEPPKSMADRMAETAADFRRLNAAGLTSIRVPGGSPDQYRLFQNMRRRGLLTLRINFLFRGGGQASGADVEAAAGRWGVAPDDGDDWLRVGGVKLGVDGGFEGGFMREAYAEPYGENGRYRGLQTMTPERLAETVKAFNRLGWRVATHAVGDAAIDQVLDAYEAAHRERTLTGRRWAIEHGFIGRPDHLPRMKALDLVISAQNHLYLAGPSLVRYWGAERTARTTPVRDYLDRGLVVAGGTDSAVVPYPPLWTIYHFVTRDTITGGVLGADQRITREEALRVSTVNNAYLTFEERQKGSIEPGKLADLVVLDEDILTVPPKRIEQMKVSMTLVGGRVVYPQP